MAAYCCSTSSSAKDRRSGSWLAFQPLFRSTQQVLAGYSTTELELLTGFLRQSGAATEQLIHDMRAAQGPAA
ncbi:MAG TPA: hypothetical protein VG123_41780 [Streptosporangiaceae bacterium]|jgi:hypothetical protein|nr:hypothetical protein [Streptosporangiaceae bacterium]